MTPYPNAVKPFAGIIAVLLLLGLVPFGLIALSRSGPSPARPVHLILDMVDQPRFNTQRENFMFADTRAMRPLLPGVVAQEDMTVANEPLGDSPFPRMIDDRQSPYRPTDQAAYDRLMTGREPTSRKAEKESTKKQATGDPNVGFVTQIPVPVSIDLLRRGRERFNIYCATCHGLGGYGDGMTARRAAEMQASGAATAAGWVAPTNYHTDEIRNRSVGNLFNTISNGIRTMPAYDKQISILDRWAIVAYVKALQRSQHARTADEKK